MRVTGCIGCQTPMSPLAPMTVRAGMAVRRCIECDRVQSHPLSAVLPRGTGERTRVRIPLKPLGKERLQIA